MFTFLKRIFLDDTARSDHHYLVLYEGPYGLAECFMSNKELAKMLRDWNPRLISISPAFPVPKGVVTKIA